MFAVGVINDRIDAMNPQDATPSRACREQVYLIERDAGLLCRILGLYAARGIDVLAAHYAYAAQDVMTLKVSTECEDAEHADMAETLRVLVEKAASLVGVIAAASQPPALRRPNPLGAARESAPA
jgi:hypothetical protein